MNTNKELELAYKFVNFTNRNIFLTGKAGTGKTTFLHRLKTSTYKRMVVVAPTGVAAINAGGVTIHSFFQLPFGPILPEQDGREEANNTKPITGYRFTKRKIDIIRSLDLLVIDEISMVRADLLDGIDQVLRKYRNRFQPFGGVQILMIGDLQQLAPVVKTEEWNLLKPYYSSTFFFGSRAFQQANVIGIELKHIYRQADETFIRILNEIREDKLSQPSLDILNGRHIPDFNPDSTEGYIRLTTHNLAADRVNSQELEKLTTKAEIFDAEIVGIFPEHAYPTAFHLRLKVGAQVMFVKNDSSMDKLYYNGKIGTVEAIDDKLIYVKCPGDYATIPVDRELWNNMKYELNDKTKELEEKIEGSFFQYPLRLAWAITIHKSQGLTFEKAIIDAQAAFAHGQTYVALSRCKSMEGLVLSSPLSTKAVICDREVNGFNQNVTENQPDEKVLSQSKKAYQLSLLDELFNFKPFEYQAKQGQKILQENSSSFIGSLAATMDTITAQCTDEIIPLSAKFMRQVNELSSHSEDIENNEELQERVKKASQYFHERLLKEWQEELKSASFETDNHAVKKDVQERLLKMKSMLQVKLTCWQLCTNGLVVSDFLSVRAKALLTGVPEAKETATPTKGIDTKNPELFRKLQVWRKELSEERDVPAFQILTQKALVAIVNELPSNSKALLAIKGVGKKTIKLYGKDILQLLADYVRDKDLDVTVQTEIKLEEKAPKGSSREISYQRFLAGETIGRIATERNMAVTTIEGHLAHYLSTGNLDIKQFVPEEKIAVIQSHFEKHPDHGLTDAKNSLGEDYSYSDLRFVKEWRGQK
ncbi:helix-turn-helix domain-containing protein [Mangrovibacterium sp.]|uniref:helix-turn-helix domain-containing protein n=1 Tax=Mangrovibacterium sp. TaxID=1961364 RepID=UPI0035654174